MPSAVSYATLPSATAELSRCGGQLRLEALGVTWQQQRPVAIGWAVVLGYLGEMGARAGGMSP